MKYFLKTEIELSSLLQISEEYDMKKVKRSIETILVKNLKIMSSEASIEKPIQENIDYLMDLMRWSSFYNLKDLLADLITIFVNDIDRFVLETNGFYMNDLEPVIKNEILMKKMDITEDELKKCKDKLEKQNLELERLKEPKTPPKKTTYRK